MKQSMKQHIRNAGNMTPTKIVKGAWNGTKTVGKISVKLFGAGIYVVDQVARSLYNTVKDGYNDTDTIINRPRPPKQATYRPIDTEPQ